MVRGIFVEKVKLFFNCRIDFGFSIRALGFLVTTIELNEIANFLDT
jgi:hypothetical protein